MVGQRRRDRELYWRDVLQRQSESGLNVANFCRQESISAASFYAWRRKLRERDAQALRIDAKIDAEANLGAQLLPVRIESGTSPAPVRIFLPQGATIDAPGNLDRRALVDLLGALREAQLC
jgi:transposase-like protein